MTEEALYILIHLFDCLGDDLFSPQEVPLTTDLHLNLSFQAVSVHCFRGRGRTGTMLACYFVKFENLTADEAIKKVRELRPGSVETKDQEDLVRDFFEYCKTEKAEKKE